MGLPMEKIFLIFFAITSFIYTNYTKNIILINSISGLTNDTVIILINSTNSESLPEITQPYVSKAIICKIT